MHEKRYAVPVEIEQLRTELCERFIATGSLDQTIQMRLQAYADEVRGKPRVELTPVEMTNRLIEFVRPRNRKRQLTPRVVPGEARYRLDLRLKNKGRKHGSRILIVQGKRVLICKEGIEDAIRNGARYPQRNVTKSPAPNLSEGNRTDGQALGHDDSLPHHVPANEPAAE